MAVQTITQENFEAEVLQSKQPVLVDFWAGWCGPCKMIAPVLEEIAKEREDIKVCKINVDEQPGLAQAFGIMSIPTLLSFQKGNATDKMVGVRTKDEILSMMEG